jgi:alkanesulfonate monooxygenase SsuD/methylene tetrahydromethanopterin reductase-like flavin-dependent oxidoreductase (luciferase family)
MPTLAAAAVTTGRIAIGTLVSSPNFRHPVLLAKEAVTLDDLSEGRFVLGIGAGTAGADARVLGEAAWTPRERADRFAEYVALVDRLLRQPVTDATGRFYRAEQAHVDPTGQARSRIGLAISATGPRGMRLAARYADIWVTNGTAPRSGLAAPVADHRTVARQLARLRAACAAEGRDPDGLRKLLLYANRTDPPLRSVAAFVDIAERYRELGITDLVVPFPRDEPPFVGDLRVLERVAAEVLPKHDAD